MIYVEVLGLIFSSVAGAMVAIDKRADIFGVLFLAVITAFGGGITRDIILGIIPHFFTSYTYVVLTLTSALIVFIWAYFGADKYLSRHETVDSIINVFDALALASYTVVGMNIAIEECGMDNALLIICLGMITGIGGGMLRDMMVNTMPFVLRKRIYAVASLAGALVYYMLLRLGVGSSVGSVAAVTLIFALRICATIFKWSLPRVKFSDKK